LITVVSAYLVDSAEKGRSGWRIDGMRWNFNKVIIPFFGAATPISSRADSKTGGTAKAQREAQNPVA
jgi:hypothetical protein